MPYIQVENNSNKKVFYVDKGQGKEVIFFIHGWHQNARDCFGSFIDLFQHSCRVIAPDLPGHGSSFKDQNQNYSLDDSYLALNGILKNISSKNIQISIVAYGAGCYFAVKAAIKNPDIIRNIVLISPEVDLQKFYSQYKKVFLSPKMLAPFLLRFRALRGLFPYDDRTFVYHETKGHRIPGKWNYFQIKSRNHPFFAARQFFKSFSKSRLLNLLPTQSKPALLCYGEFEKQETLEEVNYLADTMPAARRVKVVGAGIYPHLQASTQVQKQIQEFLEEHRKKGVNWRRFFNWKK